MRRLTGRKTRIYPALAEGRFKTAFDHFAKFGQHQGRQRPRAEPAEHQQMSADD